jgi:SAM-dependent methyltransferase
VSASERLRREIEHDRLIADNAEDVWNWDSPAGRRRADRRAGFYAEHGALGPGRRALELGVGTGVFLRRIAPSGATVFGLDLSHDLLARARRDVAGRDNVSLLRGNAEQLPFPDASFDVVYGSSVLHHLNLEPALGEARRVLKPGGLVVFTEPNLLNPQIAYTFLVGPRHWFGLSPDEQAFTRFHARRLLRRLGYEDIRVRPFDFLHPATPRPAIGAVARLGGLLESLPLVREIAGSLLLSARRP